MVLIDVKYTNKYTLSRLGDLLLKWGFGIDISIEHGKGTNVELEVMTEEEIEELFNKAWT